MRFINSSELIRFLLNKGGVKGAKETFLIQIEINNEAKTFYALYGSHSTFQQKMRKRYRKKGKNVSLS